MPYSVDHDVSAPMRDGTVLRADVYRPQGRGSLPVLLCRTPYGKSGVVFPGYAETAAHLAERGYIAVVQDTRGRFASDGDWEWLHTERAQTVETEDGCDSVAWAAALDGSDGRVGMWGNSYDAYLALRAAGGAPPSLRALFVSGIVEKLQDENRGIFRTIYLEWLSQMAADVRRRGGAEDGPTTEADAAREWAASQGKWLWRLPLSDIPDSVFGEQTPRLREYLTLQSSDRWAFEKVRHMIQVPVCHLTGWWDADAFGTVTLFRGLRAGGPAHVRDLHRLIVGPWGHSTLMAGDANTYENSDFLDYGSAIGSWFDHALKGQDEGKRWKEPVRAYVVNAARWQGAADWPPPGGTAQTWYLTHHSERAPEGALLLTAGTGSPDEYVYDPRDPVMSVFAWEALGRDQGHLSYRSDVLSYRSELFANDVVVLGDVTCTLWAASDAPDTDFVARLVEEARDGTSKNLCGGIIRARYRNGYDREEPLVPGEPTELRIELGPVGVLLRSGSRIRLDITSSDFPSYDRNHNTGKPFWSDPELVSARQLIFHDGERPSRIDVRTRMPKD